MGITEILVTLLGLANAGLIFWVKSFIQKTEKTNEAVPLINQKLAAMSETLTALGETGNKLRHRSHTLANQLTILQNLTKNLDKTIETNTTEHKTILKDLTDKLAEVHTQVTVLDKEVERLGKIIIK